MKHNKIILDACCGSKMFWFQKHRDDICYMDIRKESFYICGKHVDVDPDIVGDFRHMPFEDNTFRLVVFDPPHLRWAGEKSIMKSQYGQLSKDWKNDISKGFSECFRVLLPGGFLIFKWSDCQLNVKEILRLTSVVPLFGNQRGNTHWMVFIKDYNELLDETAGGDYR